jgi:two-component system, chemotaxis family, chemotaxis protein CheV
MDSIDRVTGLHKNNEVQYLCFRLQEGGELYAVNVFKVQEIIKYEKQPTLVGYEEDALLEGLITVRDMTVPLVDMKKWFAYSVSSSVDLSGSGLDPHNSQVMLCDFSGVFVGIRIYRADRILTKKWDEVLPSLSIGTDVNQKINNHTYYTDGSLVQIVDIEKMVSEVFPFLEEEIKSTNVDTVEIDTSKFLLVAEDSVVATKMLKGVLNKLGVRYRFFDNGRKLLEFIEESEDEMKKCGLIITDLEMPEVSGFEVIKRIKGSSALQNIPISVNSSMSGDSNKSMAYSLGANHFMQKTSPNDVAALVNKYFRK